MVPTDDEGHISAIYREFVDVISNAKPEALPPLPIDNAIDLKRGYNLPYGRFTIERS
jgi:hypothetical protein